MKKILNYIFIFNVLVLEKSNSVSTKIEKGFKPKFLNLYQESFEIYLKESGEKLIGKGFKQKFLNLCEEFQEDNFLNKRNMKKLRKGSENILNKENRNQLRKKSENVLIDVKNII